MDCSLCIYMLFVALIPIQRQFMTVNAGPTNPDSPLGPSSIKPTTSDPCAKISGECIIECVLNSSSYSGAFRCPAEMDMTSQDPRAKISGECIIECVLNSSSHSGAFRCRGEMDMTSQGNCPSALRVIADKAKLFSTVTRGSDTSLKVTLPCKVSELNVTVAYNLTGNRKECYLQVAFQDVLAGTPETTSAPTSTSLPHNTSSEETNISTNTSTPETTSAPTSTKRGKSKTLFTATVILGSLLAVSLILHTLFCYLIRTRWRSNARTPSFDTEKNMGHENLAYRQSRSLTDDELEMKVMTPLQLDAGFSKQCIYPRGHCQTLDNENGRPDNFYPDPLDSKGATSTQSEIENELNSPDSPNCCGEPLLNRPPTSLPESITKLDTTFSSTGGEVFAQGCSNWERVPNESKRESQFQAVSTFSLKDIFACGGPRSRIKGATVFASRPDPKSDLIYLRFYVYSYNEDSRRCVELAEKERFPDSRPAREKPFRMYKDNTVITVNFTHLEDGWKFINTDNTQVYKYEKAIDACDFAVIPEDGQDVNSFSCWVKFQQKDVDEEHWLYLNPGFTPLKRQSIRRSSPEGGQSNTTTSSARYEGSVHWDHYLSSLGSEPVTEEQIYEISPDVGRNWKDLLRNLSIKEKTIENLSVDFMHEKITEQCIQGLIKWKHRDPQLATVKTLATALRNVGCFDALRTFQKQR